MCVQERGGHIQTPPYPFRKRVVPEFRPYVFRHPDKRETKGHADALIPQRLEFVAGPFQHSTQ